MSFHVSVETAVSKEIMRIYLFIQVGNPEASNLSTLNLHSSIQNTSQLVPRKVSPSAISSINNYWKHQPHKTITLQISGIVGSTLAIFFSSRKKKSFLFPSFSPMSVAIQMEMTRLKNVVSYKCAGGTEVN